MLPLLLLIFLLSVSASSASPTLCDAGEETCAVSVSGGTVCAASRSGTMCAECGFRGFLRFDLTPGSNGTCVCYEAYFDPEQACAPVPGVDYSLVTSVAARSARFTCTAWADPLTGFFRQPDEDAHTYGTPNPPLITECLRAPFGPEPNAFVDALVPGSSIRVCNTFGASDPNAVAGQNDTSFVTCAGHGTWFPTPLYRCGGAGATALTSCAPGWALRDTGLVGLGGNTVPLCDVCAPWFGPSPTLGGSSQKGPFCVYTATPNNVTGLAEECGGRGSFNPGSGCTCFQNGTSATVSASFDVLQYTNPAGGTATSLVSVTAAVQTCV